MIFEVPIGHDPCHCMNRASAALHGLIKYKVNQCQEFVIGGDTHGNPFDALVMGVTTAIGFSTSPK